MKLNVRKILNTPTIFLNTNPCTVCLRPYDGVRLTYQWTADKIEGGRSYMSSTRPGA